MDQILQHVSTYHNPNYTNVKCCDFGQVGLGTASQEVLQAQRAAHAFPNSKMIRHPVRLVEHQLSCLGWYTMV